MCNCGKSITPKYNANRTAIPNQTTGTNQALLKQIADQQQQQQAIQQIIQRSANPTKTLIKTYR